MNANEALRALPAVDTLLNNNDATRLIAQYGRQATIEALRNTLDTVRRQLSKGDSIPVDVVSILAQTATTLALQFRPSLRSVINATGVIIHTNLGRAPLSQAAQAAVADIAAGYNTLEFDLDSGKRGSRLVHAGDLLCDLTGAEAALVVNNNASALVLILSALAKDREVIISRGQLVEIGGGFRVPDVMAQSGAILVEVGTTNRTRAADYERAITEATAFLMRAHASNFKVIGFTEDTPLTTLADISREHGLRLVDDLGSGALLDTAQFGLDHEPMVRESLAAGADLVAFSGDKLLGGPQAGIIVGQRDLIDHLKRHPLARAIRADKLCLAALTATLDHYRKGEATEKIPIWQMIARPYDDVRQTATIWAAQLGARVLDGESAVGGGSLPGATLPTALMAVEVPRPDAFLAELRTTDPPVIARIADNQVLFDPRTVLPGQEDRLIRVVKALSET